MTDSPLFQAAKENHSLKLRSYIQDGADPDSRDLYGETPLCWAANMGQTAIVKDLLAAGADVEAQGNLFSATPLVLAARSGARGIVALLAVHANLDARDLRGATALMRAVERPDDRVKPPGRIQAIVRTLLDQGADPNLQDEAGRTALMWAVQWGDAEAVRLLLEKGADWSVRDHSGETALTMADASANTEMVALMRGLGVGY